MTKGLSWIVVSAAAVSVGIGVTVGLGLFRGREAPPPTHRSPLAVAAAPSTVPALTAPAGDVATAVAPPEEEPAALAVLQPHVEPKAEAESDGTAAASGTSAEGGPSEPMAVTVRELASAGAEYAGREVVLTGRILNLCIRGCQLSLDDGTGVMAVELVDDALNNTIPFRSTGRQIEVTGTFRLTPRPHVSVDRPDGWRFP